MLWLVCAWPTDPSGKQRPTTRPGILLCCASNFKNAFYQRVKAFAMAAETHWQRQNLIEVFCTLS